MAGLPSEEARSSVEKQGIDLRRVTAQQHSGATFQAASRTSFVEKLQERLECQRNELLGITNLLEALHARLLTTPAGGPSIALVSDNAQSD